MIQLASMLPTIKTIGLDNINSIISDSVYATIIKIIDTTNRTQDQTFAFVWPILKNIGICTPVIMEKAKKDKPTTMAGFVIFSASFWNNAEPKYKIIIDKSDKKLLSVTFIVYRCQRCYSNPRRRYTNQIALSLRRYLCNYKAQ